AVKVELRKKQTTGIVVRLKEILDAPYAKEILNVIETDFCDQNLLRLTNWVSKYYMASWGETLTLAIPKGVYGYKPKKCSEPISIAKVLEGLAPTLNFDQHQAVRKILPNIKNNNFKVFLLFGVTGSGKTEVYLRSIEEALRQNKSAIVLVPEISLTPFYLERFAQRFSKELICLHSALLASKRKTYWQRIRNGEFRVVLGPRSAVFAPVKNLGLIVVDEEHDPSYKEKDRNPHYNARDGAIMRAKFENSVVVLGSATPSIESFYNAQNKKYELLNLKSRIDKKPLPKAIIVDMKKYKDRVFSPLLFNEILSRRDTEEQMILFLNRRGFARFILCRACGYVPKCRYCGIPLIFHKPVKLLCCHFCQYEIPIFDTCPNCKGTDFLYQGVGTQKVENELGRIIYKTPIIRMDRDTTRKRGMHEKLYQSFSEGKAKILVGTQIVSKGFDFPKVTLSGVVSADTALNLPDFRSSERTFQMLTQIVGRAGRGEKLGKAVIQTFHIDHYAVRYGAQQNFLKFYEREIKIRQQLQYPPFTKLALIRIFSSDEKTAQTIGETIKEKFKDKKGVEILGPVPAFRQKKRRTNIYHLLLKLQKDSNFHTLFDRKALAYSKAKVDIDIDPVEIL
ncbi:MAG: primosomal protein N', partial [candidate division WOR-3 bacterium]|nr:primosomal protein N' [candidate division WOR-3 bacterium]